eukprot:CAMPEP_0117022008 /NCGR_PEP_ID=MMETSP0472-20121206/16587_1 /TAXON_ID=693140 ORGANISM="Tiarina fusus, Strain LIS" /NCGR_SAMPLE_ID=MMETSP0472 /ASSEMBLY_ACC=CAM_ASM_000603 /LENGTH=88 /DNA_ID=CAMNT_0004727745 /DNA_START=58 /DNA_END=324 /DNA_ORIENTATION=-
MTKRNPMEFYDEELSRTFRQIQEMLDKDASNPRLDNLFVTCRMYIQQMKAGCHKMKDRSEQKEQWQEIIKFRSDTFRVLQSTVHTVEF